MAWSLPTTETLCSTSELLNQIEALPLLPEELLLLK
jgi:hypothetical protein